MATRLKQFLRTKENKDYFMSTNFWGPLCNWSIPIAAIYDTQKDPTTISGKMTLALTFYSMAFLRFSVRVQPKNMLLFACHVVNLSAQLTQGYRYLKYQNSLKHLQNI
ncbi:PREDICTED: mitochondrial pyruvate carrier 1-like [Ceratosolen solmsi marchali]|uniref:Mitochondrial pyruvate carrier n=1 Tax=Ceratosolen solmsi marchali TaxID=326594 RepID=A0AAJ6YEE6_9HYME|nr:PREDICTED: mitochondrial pyruvate carrier 1-like [Ceratosolen solmsi marchali]